ncbi:hypothetical protein [Mesoplasma seiffertii]|uniref:hypothetical protein n=1 Tax=Mesoplasma seiffertii TaxID=28224 RepID=UPI00055A6C20|nr:hypothetical protein [Mesoplasma seiffertii]
MWKICNKAKDDNWDSQVELEPSVPILSIDSDYQLSIDDFQGDSLGRPILISGEPGLGKTHIINRFLEKTRGSLKEIRDNNEEVKINVEYISCKSFLDTINEQKEDYFKVFMSKVVGQIKGSQKRSTDYVDRKFVLTSILSLIEFSLISAFVDVLLSDLREDVIELYCTLLSLILIFLFINTIFFIREIWRIKNWSDYREQLKKATSKSKNSKTIVIFDEINRLVLLKNQSLVEVEKKFIKEISSIKSKNLIFVFVTSEKVIEDIDNEESDFSFKYFWKVFKVEKSDKIIQKLVEENIKSRSLYKSIEDEITSLLVNVFENLNYRLLKMCLTHFDNIQYEEINTKYFDLHSFVIIHILKSLNYTSTNFGIVNKKMTTFYSYNSFLNINDIAMISEVFYDKIYYAMQSWSSIEQDWKNFTDANKAKASFSNSSQNNCFTKSKYLISLMQDYKSSNFESSEKVEKIRKVYSVLMKNKIASYSIPKSMSFLDEYDPFAKKIYSFERGYSHFIIYNFEYFLKLIKIDNFESVIENRKNQDYWIFAWIFHKFNSCSDSIEEINFVKNMFDVFSKTKYDIGLVEFFLSLYFAKTWKRITEIEVKDFPIIKYETIKYGYTLPAEACVKKGELIKKVKSLSSNEQKWLDVVHRFYEYSDHRFKFSDLFWELVYCSNNDDEKKEIIDFFLDIGMKKDELLLLLKNESNKGLLNIEEQKEHYTLEQVHDMKKKIRKNMEWLCKVYA